MNPALAPARSGPRPELVDGLARLLEREAGQPVTRIETHISWVLLAGDRAYKLKKAVRLPFADFSTRAARQHFCEEELRLNRRLAPDLYLSVLAVGGTLDAPCLAPSLGPGEEPLDQVVCMRRFPTGALMGERLAAGLLDAEALAQLAGRLAAFHRSAAVAPPEGTHGQPQQKQAAVLSVLDQLEWLLPGPALAGLRRRTLALADGLRPVWLDRLQQGAVREAHGDLHLGNVVCLDDGPRAFDCIEFDPALRWIDVMGDVAFLAMDLQAQGRPDLAAGFLDAYLQASGDWAGLAVLRFEMLYRALVRALVAALQRPGQPSPYLYCACELVQAPPVTARLLITHGPSGSGKSTVAGQLLALTGAVRLRSDVERKRLFGLAPLQKSHELALDIYTPEATEKTFDALRRGAAQALKAGYPVVVDAVFSRRSERQAFRNLARQMGLPFGILDCRADAQALRHRVAARLQRGDDPSEADLAVLERQLARAEALAPDEQKHLLVVQAGTATDLSRLAARWQAWPADDDLSA